MRIYVGYGSNLNMAQMAVRCPGAIPLGVGELRDWRLIFKGSKTGSYLTIEPCKGYTVPVVLWSVTEKDECNLDVYEGFPRFYYKEEIKVRMKPFMGAVRSVDAFVYLMRRDAKVGIPTDGYYRTCLEGYRRFGFDEEILQRAYDDSYWEVHTNGRKKVCV